MTSKTIVESPPLIYGLDHECRAMCAQSNEYLPTRFFVGTQSLESSENQIHLLEFGEDNNSLSKMMFQHKCGEIWHLTSFSKQCQQIITCYSSHSNSNTGQNHCSLWRIPVDISSNLNEDENQLLIELNKVHDFTTENLKVDEGLGKKAQVKPEDEDELILMLDTKLVHLKLETKGVLSCLSTETPNNKSQRSTNLTTFCWSPHSNGNIVAIVSNNNIYSKDLRTSNAGWHISQAHSQIVRDIDFNPNSQYYLASCGDDCKVKFWDIRNTSKPALKMLHHSHWVWSVRYNSFHDHLVLSSSSDGNVNLLRASSIASQPYGHLIEDELEEEDSTIKSLLTSKPQLKDGLIRTFEDHEDSVYAIEWSPNDPWIFASLSYDGRFIINKVPENEKSSILG